MLDSGSQCVYMDFLVAQIDWLESVQPIPICVLTVLDRKCVLIDVFVVSELVIWIDLISVVLLICCISWVLYALYFVLNLNLLIDIWKTQCKPSQ